MTTLIERRDARQAELQGKVDEYNTKQQELVVLADEIKSINGAVKELAEQVKEDDTENGEACPA